MLALIADAIFFSSFILFLYGFIYWSMSLERTDEFSSLNKGILIMIAGASMIYVSHDCYASYFYVDIHSGRVKSKFILFGVEVSENVNHTDFSNLYRSCNGRNTSTEWGFVSGQTGPFGAILDSTLAGNIYTRYENIAFVVQHRSSMNEKKKCVIVEEFVKLAKKAYSRDSYEMVECFADKISREQNRSVNKIRHIRRKCIDKYESR